MDLDLDADDITAGCCDGTNIYVVAEKNTEKEAANPFTGETYTAYSSEYCIYKVPLDGAAHSYTTLPGSGSGWRCRPAPGRPRNRPQPYP